MNKLKRFVPPILVDLKKQIIPSQYGWFGDYQNWQEASTQSSGYDSDEILNKVIHATQAVLNGEAEFERDSVLFYEKDYLFCLSTALLWVASQHNLNLNVLDFGGSLGSTFYQNRLFLENINLSWNIVEQKNFVEAGRKNFQNDRLKFHHSISECTLVEKPHIALLSSVLAYLPKPYEILEEIFLYDFEYLILDKHPLIEADKDRLTIQKVHPQIYNASYPAWFFSSRKFYDFLSTKYEVMYEYERELDSSVDAKFTFIVAKLK
ncbi:TIGR04325 family methyltransferase [Pontibacter rugosus]